MNDSETILNLPVILSIGIALLMAIIAGFLFFRLKKSEKKRIETENRFSQLEKEVNLLQLENLESRLNPHLFKNILNSIQSHAYQTYFAIDKLTSVLDYILYESRRKFVTPKEEIEFALNLVEINKIKLSPLFELKIKQKILKTNPLYEQRLLAPMISIDLIENAFKHADLQSPESFISITFEFTDESVFALTVANKISAKNPLIKEKKGFGTESLEQRLKIIYKGCYKLDRFVEDDVYIAHLKINLLEYKAEMFAIR